MEGMFKKHEDVRRGGRLYQIVSVAGGSDLGALNQFHAAMTGRGHLGGLNQFYVGVTCRSYFADFNNLHLVSPCNSPNAYSQ